VSYPRNDAKLCYLLTSDGICTDSGTREWIRYIPMMTITQEWSSPQTAAFASLDVPHRCKEHHLPVDKKAVDRQGEMDYKSLPLCSSKTGLSMEYKKIRGIM
jgi:hypothetical protein